ncbi:nuclear transport factor 2 family protein [Sphingomonas sp.]|jgi:uncharacterized protein (TIGR02246 family)|uniref:YybH family protein n=1 Tax=Sphingomonas sp. TaxID=28214 RepID=UPI002ED8A409
MMVFLAAAAALPVVAAAPATSPSGIEAAMAASAAGWNAGDLARFMEVYAHDATYVTPKGLVTGKAAIADRYRASFADGRNRRGTLSFRMLGHRAVDPRHHILFARWTLSGGAVTESGMTTLVFERQGNAWRILTDHSS